MAKIESFPKEAGGLTGSDGSEELVFLPVTWSPERRPAPLLRKGQVPTHLPRHSRILPSPFCHWGHLKREFNAYMSMNLNDKNIRNSNKNRREADFVFLFFKSWTYLALTWVHLTKTVFLTSAATFPNSCLCGRGRWWPPHLTLGYGAFFKIMFPFVAVLLFWSLFSQLCAIVKLHLGAERMNDCLRLEPMEM